MTPVGTRVECDVPTGELELFAAGGIEGASRRRILEHLLAGCDRCRGRLAELGGYLSPRTASEEDEASTARILARLRQAAELFDRERLEAAELLPAFLEHPVARQWTLLRNSRRYDSWAFAAALLDVAYRALYDDARRTLELAQMALEIADRLDPEPYGERQIHDLRGRAFALRGNARRTLGDLRAAAGDLGAARRLYAEGSGDPLVEAELDYFEASWRVDSGDLHGALRSVRRSARVYRELGEQHLEGRSINSEASILGLLGRSANARERYREAARKVDPERDLQLALAVRHNLVWQLVEDDCLDEARWQLAAYEREFERASHGSSLAKLAWLRARILLKTGERGRAEPAFRAAIDSFAELELPFEAALVALDLCGLLAEGRRWSEVRELAAGTHAILRSLGVGSEATAAWLTLERAAEAEAVTAALLGRLALYFSEAKAKPGLRFER